jgi:hypothetical protein
MSRTTQLIDSSMDEANLHSRVREPLRIDPSPVF